MSGLFAEKAGRMLLLAAINRAARKGSVFTFADITFGNPTAGVFQGRNTEVVYTARHNHPKYEGTQQAFFNRIDLEAMFAASNITEVQVRASEVNGNSTADVVTAVNARYGLGFDDNDIVDETFEDGDNPIVLRANPLSHGYSGEIVVELVYPAGALASVVVSSVIDDLILPEPVTPGTDI